MQLTPPNPMPMQALGKIPLDFRALGVQGLSLSAHKVQGPLGAGALIVDGALLVAQRGHPPELAGRWELPGGKAAPGESDADALVRELREELGVDVVVGERIGDDVPIGESLVLRAYLVAHTGEIGRAHV